jgi:hypothetical protein
MSVYQFRGKSPTNPGPRIKHLDGDPLQVEMIDKTPEKRLRVRPGMEAWHSGRPLEQSFMPTILSVSNGMKGVTDLDGYQGITFVSPRFKAIIEELEPGVHQFFPLELVDSKKRHLADHWIWVICNALDTVDGEASGWEFRYECRWHPRVGTKDKLTFSKNKIGNHHFWREKFMMPGHFRMASETAFEKMQSAGLTFIHYIRWETI